MRMDVTSERGTTLIETVVAGGILCVLMAGLLGLIAVSTRATENQGHLAARTTEYAQDKVEQLVSLASTDVHSDTRTFPAGTSTGSGLAAGGSSDPNAPVATYLDWLNANGDLLTSTGTTPPSNWYYKRVWQITDVTTHLKKITVTTTVARTIGGDMAPSTTLTVLKSNIY
jgi:hypothetical protein